MGRATPGCWVRVDTGCWKGAGRAPTFLGGIVWFVPLAQHLLSHLERDFLASWRGRCPATPTQGSEGPGLPEGPEPGHLGSLGGCGLWDGPSPPAWGRSRWWLSPGPSPSWVQVGCWKRGRC